MIRGLSSIGAQLRQSMQRMRVHYALGINERQGIDLTTGARATCRTLSNPLFTLRRRRVLVAAAPQHAFRLHVVPLEPPLSQAHVMAVLSARGMDSDDMVTDFLMDPGERASAAVFSLPCAQCDQWLMPYSAASEQVVALEPDVHALWRQASRLRMEHHAWLIVDIRHATLYWPTAWPWGYHAEPLPLVLPQKEEDAHYVLHSTRRRVGVLTGNDAPASYAMLLAGPELLCQRWKASVHDVDWHLYNGPHPVAAGAMLKGRRRWA